MYGGNGQTTFGLPNLQGRSAIMQGQGPGLSARYIGESGGAESVVLTVTTMPSHTHTINAKPTGGTATPTNMVWGTSNAAKAAANFYAPAAAPPVTMNASALAPNGTGQPHNNMMPYLVVFFGIALQGVYPPRQ